MKIEISKNQRNHIFAAVQECERARTEHAKSEAVLGVAQRAQSNAIATIVLDHDPQFSEIGSFQLGEENGKFYLEVRPKGELTRIS